MPFTTTPIAVTTDSLELSHKTLSKTNPSQTPKQPCFKKNPNLFLLSTENEVVFYSLCLPVQIKLKNSILCTKSICQDISQDREMISMLGPLVFISFYSEWRNVISISY